MQRRTIGAATARAWSAWLLLAALAPRGAYAPWQVAETEKRLILEVTFETSKVADLSTHSCRLPPTSLLPLTALMVCLAVTAVTILLPSRAVALTATSLAAKDYEITSPYAVRGWNTTEGHMRLTVPSRAARHGGEFGLAVRVDRAFDKNFHAQADAPLPPHSLLTVSLPHPMASPTAVSPSVLHPHCFTHCR